MRYTFSLLIILALASVSAADYKAEFEKGFLAEPWAGEAAEKSVCIECHTSDIMKPDYRKIPDEWKMSWHYQNNVSCHDCHGGDPKDSAMAMTPQSGFVGTPKYKDVPEFCGKCHIGILKNYLESGHGNALKVSGNGPNCVTCHGAHNIQKASIEIIDEKKCTQCHSYERAKIMKQALFITENKINDIDKDLQQLKRDGVFIEEDGKELFRTQAEFRTLFHTVDVSLVKAKTDEFMNSLNILEKKIAVTFKELAFRKNFSVFIMLIFIGMAVVIALLSKAEKN